MSRKVRTQFLELLLDAGQSEWTVTLSTDAVLAQNPGETLHMFCKKAVLRNDFPVITSGRNRCYVDGQARLLRTGSPNVVAFIEELNRVTAPLVWQFDPYDARVRVNNPTAQGITLNSDQIAPILGFLAGDYIVPANGSLRANRMVDLAPPEVVVLRCDLLSSSKNMIEVTSSGQKSSDALVFIGMNVSPLNTCVYLDESGHFSHEIRAKQLNRFRLRLEDVRGVPLVPQNDITLILCFEYWVNDAAELIKASREIADHTRLQVLGTQFAQAPTQ